MDVLVKPELAADVLPGYNCRCATLHNYSMLGMMLKSGKKEKKGKHSQPHKVVVQHIVGAIQHLASVTQIKYPTTGVPHNAVPIE